jgi:hypothetical protein
MMLERLEAIVTSRLSEKLDVNSYESSLAGTCRPRLYLGIHVHENALPTIPDDTTINIDAYVVLEKGGVHRAEPAAVVLPR